MPHRLVLDTCDVDERLVDHRAHGPLAIRRGLAPRAGTREGHSDAVRDQLHD